MTPTTVVLIALLLVLAAAIGGYLLGAHLRGRREEERAAERARSHEQVLALATQRARLDAESGARLLREELAAAETRVEGLSEQLHEARRQAEQRAAQDRDEQRVLQQLAPLRDSLGKLERSVVTMEQQRLAQHGELSEQLRHAARAEEQLRGTAESLAAALRSNNTRGLWGETQLRRIIEAAGMIERVDFEVQQQVRSETGAARPDVIVRLPGGKSIAIDAKVPFDSYLRAQHLERAPRGSGVAAAEHATGRAGGVEPGDARAGEEQHPGSIAPGADEQRAALLAKHAKALRDHIVALSGRGYWSALDDSPEFVIAFVPSESLLSSALDTDPLLLEFAFERRVALASPVSLWAILKSVAHSWRQESLTAEARTLFDLSRELHTRLGRTAGHLDKLGRTLSRGVQDYNAFVGSLERQVFPTARKIGALNGDRIGAEPAQLEDAVRPLVAPELRSQPETGD